MLKVTTKKHFWGHEGIVEMIERDRVVGTIERGRVRLTRRAAIQDAVEMIEVIGTKEGN